MPRNLDRRVETLFPVEDEALARRLRSEILETYLRDNVKARLMQPDGTYVRVSAARGRTRVTRRRASWPDGRVL